MHGCCTFLLINVSVPTDYLTSVMSNWKKLLVIYVVLWVPHLMTFWSLLVIGILTCINHGPLLTLSHLPPWTTVDSCRWILTVLIKLALHTWVMMVLNPGLIILPSPLLFVVQSPQYTQFKMAQIYPTITLWHSCQTSLKLYWTVHQRLNALLQLFGQRPPLKTFADIKMLTPDLWQP